ncbi:glycosyltransferase family 2 protein [Tenacibaculum finnmarkense]|uniref:glycosyltransferase family 2 protein n=1 Tax=Tenacibaculum finnmarkense TaxID=2781243 RepID=UPI001E4EA61F|nr:glycosyltransferase family 2 protein [Tenacibaculum finnmarkense]MCD8410896.1 glycosyltransferase [Tenacibaculum finnmarkense genomovar ulcerans]
MNNKVSIITPSYNSKNFIEATITSVINQGNQNWEMIIVDDCSKDNSVEFIERIIKNEPRIRLIALDKNVGAAEARNVALRNAKGKFIAFLDSDDTWYPKKLEVQLKFMEDNDVAFSFSDYDVMDASGKSTNKTIKVPKEITYKKYLSNTIIGCLTVVINKDKVGYFEMPNIKSSHDMALWLLILKKGYSAYGINQTLASYRLVATSNTANKSKAAKDVWKVYRNVEKLSILRSGYCFLGYAFNAIKKRI